LLAGLTKGAHRRLAGADEIADRLMGLIGHPDRRQFTGAVQSGKVDRIAAVRFDPIARFAGDQRRRNHGTFVAHCTRPSRRGEKGRTRIAQWRARSLRLARQGTIRPRLLTYAPLRSGRH